MRLINNVKKRGWWVCGICGRRRHAPDLRWQNLDGSLRCEHCYDDPRHVLYSQRTNRIAAILAIVPRYGEPEFEPRLAEPDWGVTTEV
jgi:hypothetical protein